MSTLTSQIGTLGEQAAVDFLRSKGFYIRERNWRNGRYEIDIIAEKWGEIHFVEVKTRKAGGWSTPEMAITREKFNSLRHAAAAYLGMISHRGEHQFDLIAVEMLEMKVVELRYIEKAMQSSW